MESHPETALSRLIVCHECDALYRTPDLPEGGVARCARCGAELFRSSHGGPDRALAWTLTGLILLPIAHLNPLLVMHLGGRIRENTLLAGVEALAREGMWDLALLVFGTTMLAPGLLLAGMFYLLLPLRFGRAPRGMAEVFRLVRLVTPWSMVGVFLLGILVAYVKLTAMAGVVPGLASHAMGGLMVAIAAARASLDDHALWNLAPEGS
ncbi:MAG: paraquat-inducible protein A [Magnetococcales bacterium]|nr:paraquat-inducible protein A [Magnetococcales bacterium]